MGGPTMLLVSREPDVQHAMAQIAVDGGVRLRIVASIEEATSLLATEPVCLVVCSAEFADQAIGVLIRPAHGPGVPVIVDAPEWNKEQYFNFLLAGAFDYVLRENKAAIERALKIAIKLETPKVSEVQAVN